MSGAITSITDAIEAQHQKFLEAFRAGDAAATHSILSEKILLMPPNEPTISGLPAVTKWFEDYFDHFKVAEFTDLRREVVIAENWAFEQTTFKVALVPKAGGPAIRDEGRGVALWKRTRAGSWKIQRQIWNSTKPFGASMGRMMAKLSRPKPGN